MGGHGREITDNYTGAIMVEVSQEVITQYLTDSVNKELTVETLDPVLEDVNYYTGDVIGSEYNMISGSTIASGGNIKLDLFSMADESVSFENCVEWSYVQDHDYIVIDLYLKVEGTLSVTTGKWVLEYVHKNGNTYTMDIKTDDISNYSSVNKLSLSISYFDGFDYVSGVYFQYDALCTYTNLKVSEAQIQINYTDTASYVPPYYPAPDFTKFKPEEVGWFLDNNNLIYEDFALTESLCSQDNLKFGLCEAAHCEFSEVGVDGMYIGQKIRPYSSLPNYPSTIPNSALEAINWSPLKPNSPYIGASGTYNIHYAVNLPAFKQDISEYYDKYFTGRYIGYQVRLKEFITAYSDVKPTYFKLRVEFKDEDGATVRLYFEKYYEVADFESDYATVSAVFPTTYNGKKLLSITGAGFGYFKADKSLFAEGDTMTASFNWMDYQIHSMQDPWDGVDPSPIPDYNVTECLVYNGRLDEYLAQFDNRIPLGEFAIASITNEYKHNVIKKKITAYDDLVKLEDNAADWYTQYMFGIDTEGYTSNGYEYARQIYSSYWSYVSAIGLDSVDNYVLTDVATLDTNNFIVNSSSCYKYIRWNYLPGGGYFYRTYGAETVNIADPTLLYRVIYDNVAGYSDRVVYSQYFPWYVESGYDTINRGYGSNGGVLIEEYKTGANDPYNCICVDRGAFFMLSPETAFIKIVLPSGKKDSLGFSICQNIKLQSAIPRQRLTNGNLRLCYYNYGTKAVFACDSSITGRDVVRSLLEVCGCFFRLDRYKGLPEFVYPTKGGLYPSNTLFPADDLYPRHGTDQIYAMGRYISLQAENYTVKDFGCIQILKNVKSSDTQSVVEWQYEGDPDAPNTYIIDDNIFYCAEEMEYDYGNMPEVSDMLAGMWSRINNMGYVPNITQALGAPWLECGDRVGLLTFNGGFETFIFRRTLKGIQNLRDTYESEGDEINNAINDFGYSIYSV